MLCSLPGPPGPGDLGRRIARRRRELGISLDELSHRSGMSVRYLEALERRPAQPTTRALLRIASSLETTAGTLLGIDAERASSHGPADARSRLKEVSPGDAWRLLEDESVGRVVLDTDDRGPTAMPVNYRVLDGQIVFRTASDSMLDRAAGNRVGFEVDDLDSALARGWSVLVSGRLERVADFDEARRLTRQTAKPWAGGHRPVVMRVVANTITARRVSVRW